MGDARPEREREGSARAHRKVAALYTLDELLSQIHVVVCSSCDNRPVDPADCVLPEEMIVETAVDFERTV